MTSVSEVICCAPSGDRCGEGIIWHEREQAVYWTDIPRFLIHRYRPADNTVQSWHFSEPVTTILLTAAPGTLAVSLGSRVILWEPASDARRDFAFHLSTWPANRLNDAGIDPRGSLWVGSMRNNVNPDGSETEAGGADGVLFRVDPDGTTTEWESGLGVSNTLVWSPDHRLFYFGDTLRNEIWSYSYDPQSGGIKKLGTHFGGFPRGFPDGSAIDEEGYIWNCRWGGSCIVRVAPDGSVDQVIEMPTRNITNCTFGDQDYKTLYITTAASPDPGDRLAGSLFSVKTGVRGLPAGSFAI